MSKWPKDSPETLKQFYGDPGKGEVERQLIPVVPPFKMYYEGKPIKAIQFHKKAAPALLAALTEIWDKCGHDQAKVDQCGASDYGGSYNKRLIRGSSTVWSNHAYGAAIDLNADENGLGAKGNMPAFVVAAFQRQGAKWGGTYKGRKDPMHFEFVDNGLADTQKFEDDAPQTDSDNETSDPTPPDDSTSKALKELSDKVSQLDDKTPWYKRVWTYVAGTLFGGGLTVGGITLDANTILSVCLLIVILGIFGLIYWFLIRKKV